MASVRLGIIGLGNMGGGHANNVVSGKVSRCELTAVCDRNESRRLRIPETKAFARAQDLMESRLVDAVLIATPHFSHTTIGIDALRQGLHVLVEKPISAHKADCERLLATHTNPKQVFAAMLQQRTDPYYQKVRELVRDGELGEVRRVNWIITNWFRTDAYYASSDWRATWAGEGGGVLLNQCLHNLDLIQWIIGMPATVRGFCRFGRYHDIEVEDDVTAYFEYPNGATAVFVTSTGEAPGTNRLEVAGERGRLVYENDTLTFTRNEVPMSEFSATSHDHFTAPPTTEHKLAFPDHGGQHVEMLQNFVDAILDSKPLIAPAAEGIHSVELANAIVFSSAQNTSVTLPVDAAAYEEYLNRNIANSRFKKKVAAEAPLSRDFTRSSKP